MTRRSVPGARPLVATSAAAVVVTLALLPFGTHHLGASVSFLPAVLAVVACIDVIAVYLLLGDFTDRGDRRLLAMAAAYCWSLVVMTGYALAFPGVVSTQPPLAITHSTAPYLYLAWHGGFPVLLGLAWARWPHQWTAPAAPAGRRSLARTTVAAATLAGMVAVGGFAASAHHLPTLISGTNTGAMTRITAPFTLPAVAVALVLAVRGTRRRSGPERWTPVAVLVCLCDLVLTYAAHYRYSLGWYVGRGLTLTATGIILIAMLAGFRRLKAQAERDAAIDPLTGLANRRAVATALDYMTARCQRTGDALSVLALDLDHFKTVNDLYGHDAGDLVLAELADLLTSSCRASDVVARLGGEEFLILLPDTATAGAFTVAARIRHAMTGMLTPTVAYSLTASIGIAALQPGQTPAELRNRADQAMYRAKADGRDRVRFDVPQAVHAAHHTR